VYSGQKICDIFDVSNADTTPKHVALNDVEIFSKVKNLNSCLLYCLSCWSCRTNV